MRSGVTERHVPRPVPPPRHLHRRPMPLPTCWLSRAAVGPSVTMAAAAQVRCRARRRRLGQQCPTRALQLETGHRCPGGAADPPPPRHGTLTELPLRYNVVTDSQFPVPGAAFLTSEVGGVNFNFYLKKDQLLACLRNFKMIRTSFFLSRERFVHSNSVGIFRFNVLPY